MYERAKRHPARRLPAGAGRFEDALAVFETWLDQHHEGRGSKWPESELDAERAMRKKLAGSTLVNKHAKGSAQNGSTLTAWLKQDQKQGRGLLKSAGFLRGGKGSAMNDWSGESFVATFGGPGEHGYGKHQCDAAARKGLPLYECACEPQAYSGLHRILCDNVGEGSGLPDLGKRFPLSEFELEYCAATQTAVRVLMPSGKSHRGPGGTRPKRLQQSVLTFARADSRPTSAKRKLAEADLDPKPDEENKGS